jgi:Bacterial membrane protein YfhO
LEPASPLSVRSLTYSRIMGARAVWEGSWKVLSDPLPLPRLSNRAVLMTNRETLISDNALAVQTSLMGRTFTPPGFDRDLDQINHFDFSSAVLVEAPLSLDPQASGSIDLIDDRPGHLKLVANATGPMLATTGVRFHRGWTVTIDDRPRDSLRVNGMLLGFSVPAGHHTIECRFDPTDFRYGEMISIFGMIALILYVTAICWFKPAC